MERVESGQNGDASPPPDPRAARDVAEGQPWPFTEHRSQAALGSLQPLTARAATIARALRRVALAIERGEITVETLGISCGRPIDLDRTAAE